MGTDLLTTSDAAKRLDRSPDRIRQLERAGKLPAQKTRSGVRLFKAADVDRLARQLGSDKEQRK
ncbi:MAG TPA: helix-turn-helix domain-containing protein [Nitrospiraceae bacterium]|nr:helix-turn-helix domain-containing protein [Nitrospiraceae bacterium]